MILTYPLVECKEAVASEVPSDSRLVTTLMAPLVVPSSIRFVTLYRPLMWPFVAFTKTCSASKDCGKMYMKKNEMRIKEALTSTPTGVFVDCRSTVWNAAVR